MVISGCHNEYNVVMTFQRNPIMENDEKLDSEFRFVLDLSLQERKQSGTLNTGYNIEFIGPFEGWKSIFQTAVQLLRSLHKGRRIMF